MDRRQWIDDFLKQAHRNGDKQRLRLNNLLCAGDNTPVTEAERKLAYYEQGRLLAQNLDEKWWVALFERWQVQTLLFHLSDTKAALDLASRLILEMRKPLYASFPHRPYISLDLVSCYLRIDPIGYQQEIKAVLDFLEVDRLNNPEFDINFRNQKCSYFSALDDAQLLTLQWEQLRVCEAHGTVNKVMAAQADLCSALYKFDRENSCEIIDELSASALTAARKKQNERLIASMLMWQAVAARWKRKWWKYQKLYDEAWQFNKRLNSPRTSIYRPATAFHEIAGEPEQMLRIVQLALHESNRHSLNFVVVSRRLSKLKLLLQLGRNTSRERERYMRVASRLKSQNHWENCLRDLESP